MKVKTIQELCLRDLENSINDFIVDKEVVDIKQLDDSNSYVVLIMYK